MYFPNKYIEKHCNKKGKPIELLQRVSCVFEPVIWSTYFCNILNYMYQWPPGPEHGTFQWLMEDFSGLGPLKSEFIIIGTRAQLDILTKLSIDQVKVSAVSSVRSLGTWLDNHLTMTTAINKTCQSGLYHLHNIRHIKRFLNFKDRKSIIQAIVMPWIVYCNSLLYSVTATNLTKLQWVQNVAARLVCSVPRHEHVTLSLINLHWLPIRFRINFKIAMFAFKCIHRQAPNYLKNLIVIKKSTRHNLR